MLFAERIDKIGDKIFFFGTGFQDFFLVFYNDFIVGDFDDFFARDGELGVQKSFDGGAFDDDLLDGEVVVGYGVVRNFAKFGAFFGVDFEIDEIELEGEDFANLNDIVWADEVVDAVDNYAQIGVFADGFCVEDRSVAGNKWTGETKGDDFERIGVDDGFGNEADRGASLETKDGSI